MAPIPIILGYNAELFFATAVLRLKSLHYGFWDTPPEKVGLASIREAQTRFTERLMEFVPDNAGTVLDVGAGIGDSAQALAQRGLKVTAISPDRNHGRYFRKLRRQGIAYIRTGFENLDIAGRFDLIFICEALNYFDREIGLEQCRRYLDPNGHLLIASMFRHPDGKAYPERFALADLPYIALANKFGFTLLATRDVTANVLPTIEYAHRSLQRYAFPVVEALSWLSKTPLRQAIGSIQEVRSYYERRTEPEYFRTHIRYVFLLFASHRTSDAFTAT